MLTATNPLKRLGHPLTSLLRGCLMALSLIGMLFGFAWPKRLVAQSSPIEYCVLPQSGFLTQPACFPTLWEAEAKAKSLSPAHAYLQPVEIETPVSATSERIVRVYRARPKFTPPSLGDDWFNLSLSGMLGDCVGTCTVHGRTCASIAQPLPQGYCPDIATLASAHIQNVLGWCWSSWTVLGEDASPFYYHNAFNPRSAVLGNMQLFGEPSIGNWIGKTIQFNGYRCGTSNPVTETRKLLSEIDTA